MHPVADQQREGCVAQRLAPDLEHPPGRPHQRIGTPPRPAPADRLAHPRRPTGDVLWLTARPRGLLSLAHRRGPRRRLLALAGLERRIEHRQHPRPG